MRTGKHAFGLLGMALLAPCLASCFVSVHPGVKAVHLDGKGGVMKEKATPRGLVVSCEQDRMLSDDTGKLLHITIENASEDWIKIPEVTLSARRAEMASRIVAPAGEDMAVWLEGMATKQRMRAHNVAAFFGALALTGAVVAAAGDGADDDGARAAGGVMLATGLMAAATHDVGQAIEAEHRSLETGALYPENHILAGKLNLPPGMFVRKHILLVLQKGARPTDLFYLDFLFPDGRAESVALPVGCDQTQVDRYRR